MNSFLKRKVMHIIKRLSHHGFLFEEEDIVCCLAEIFNHPDLLDYTNQKAQGVFNTPLDIVDASLKMVDIIAIPLNVATSLIRYINSGCRDQGAGEGIRNSEILDFAFLNPNDVKSIQSGSSVAASNERSGRIYDHQSQIASILFADIFHLDFVPNVIGNYLGSIQGERDLNIMSSHMNLAPADIDSTAENLGFFESFSMLLGQDVLLLSLHPICDRDRMTTCIGYLFIHSDKKWFPFYVSDDASFDELFLKAKEGIASVDEEFGLATEIVALQAAEYSEVPGGKIATFSKQGTPYFFREFIEPTGPYN